MNKTVKTYLGDHLHIAVPLLAIVLSLVFGAAVILALGKNPVTAYYSLLQGAGILPKSAYAGHKSVLTDFMAMLNSLTPMIFAALSVAVALKAGLFNIGVSGQMLISGFAATILVGYVEGLGFAAAKPAVLAAGVLFGGLAGAFVGYLKYKFNTNEVVSSIMSNYIIMYVISFFINANYIDPVSRQSRYITEASRLTLVDFKIGALKTELPLGILIAL